MLLNHKVRFPAAVAHGQQVTVITPVEELFTLVIAFTLQEIELVISVQMHLVGHGGGFISLQQLLFDVGIARGGDKRWEPVIAGKHAVNNRAWLDMARPADHRRYAEAAFPAGVFLSTERGFARIWPGGRHWAVIGGVNQDGIVFNAQIFNFLQHFTNHLVVLNHPVCIRPQTCGTNAAVFQVGFVVHTRGVEPGKERFPGFHLTFHKVVVGRQRLFVHGAHTLHGQWTGIFNLAVSGTLDHAARPERFTEGRIFRVIRVFRLFFSVQVIQVAEELIKPVRGWQELIAVAEVVFTKLTRGITQLLKRAGNRNIFFLQALRRTRHTDFTHPGTEWHLTRNESGTAGSRTLLGVVGGKFRPLSRDAVDVRGFIPHGALVIGTQVPVTNVITENHHNVRF